jgi:mycothiol synthase
MAQSLGHHELVLDLAINKAMPTSVSMLNIQHSISPIRITPPSTADLAALQTVWRASQDHDEPAGRPYDGWWSIPNWATAIRVLAYDGEIIGFAALEYRPGADAAEARLGLLPKHRRPGLAEELIRNAIELAQAAGAARLRLYAPEEATWTTIPAHVWGFRPLRAQHLMLRPAAGPTLSVPQGLGTHIRRLRTGEDTALLAALNHAWAGTWNFRPITASALADDLQGQRAGMLVAVAEADESHIIGTAHARFDRAHHNPDGNPYAWISNLTNDPAWRGRGLGRALLMAGLANLQERGARSIALQVDGSNDTALNLYRSVGFELISTVVILEHTINAGSLISSHVQEHLP